MQVIEKVKVVPEGYNGAGMNYDGCNRRDVNGKANAGLTLGIIGTALGAWALFGNRRSSVLGGAGGGMLGDGSTNINVLGATAGSKISKFQLKEFGMPLMLKLHHLHKNNKICFLITKTM